ncbi:MAG: hypothetical protein U0231_11295 [Nitrospiraceae bacterium]
MRRLMPSSLAASVTVAGATEGIEHARPLVGTRRGDSRNRPIDLFL